MSHSGFLPFLASGSISNRHQPAEFRQTICARLSGDARLGQNAARAPFAAGDRGENERKIPRSFFASYRWETRVTQASCLWGQRGSSRLQDSGMMPVMPAAED